MARATYQQTSFLSGEWSPFYQGRSDDPHYRRAMNVCRNGLPIEEGTWVRRPGSRLKAPPYKNQSAKIYAVEFTTDEPYDVEFTNGAIRFFQGHDLVLTTDGEQPVTAISTATPAQITLTSPVTWATDDEILFTFDSAHPSGGLPLRQRTFLVTKVDTTHFTLRDSLTGSNIDGSTVSLASGTTLTASRVLRISTPYTSGSWSSCRIVQNQDFGIVLNSQFVPYQLEITAGATAGQADATLTKMTLIDGPYLDPVVDSSGNASLLTWTGGTLNAPTTSASTSAYAGGASAGDIIAVKQGDQYSYLTWTGHSPGAGGGGSLGSTAPALIEDDTGWAPADPSSVAGSATGTITVTAQFKDWSSSVYYVADNCVTHSGTSYKATAESNAVEPGVTAGWASYWTAIDSGYAVTGLGSTTVGFQASDVGRLIRMRSRPAEWVSTRHYYDSQVCTFGDAQYAFTGAQFIAGPASGGGYGGISPNSFTAPQYGTIPEDQYDNSQVGTPDLNATTATLRPGWTPITDSSNWVWGRIASVTSTSTATVTIDPGSAPIVYPLDNFAFDMFRLGAWSDTTEYPACGMFYEGRFWFGGAVKNRFDTTETYGWNKDTAVLEMSPTVITGDSTVGFTSDGTVADASGISYTLESRDANEIFWFEPNHGGLMCGSLGGEWLISASNLSDPITPTSIQAKRVTKYGCANIEPKRTGLSVVFVQKYKRRVMEFLADVFTGRYTAPHLNEAAKHLTTNGVEQLDYQEELAPIVWARITSP